MRFRKKEREKAPSFIRKEQKTKANERPSFSFLHKLQNPFPSIDLQVDLVETISRKDTNTGIFQVHRNPMVNPREMKKKKLWSKTLLGWGSQTPSPSSRCG
ncbi:hypothetical protein I3842_10G108700 [Carya illinoinensis]|uniref:Uncharacterized protein n=1 Tax=Carya illinoinensis TaxID=32201 RepID=A0A922DY91_CARIL|nr:hypothetical protein I3842_10G108700 [Carya illinoinensis]